MLGLVLSGAGNFGAMQAGALEVLFGIGIRPNIVVGTSAGALNAVYIASDPTPSGVIRLANAWREVGPDEVGMPSLLTGVRRLISRKDSLIDSQALAGFVKRQLPSDAETFRQLTDLHGIHAYAVAVCMETGRLIVFGDRDEDLVLDGVMASTAIPPYFPPWKIGDRRYLDGGVLSKLPVRAAIERGATEVIAVDVSYTLGTLEGAHGMIGISGYSLSLMMEHQTSREIEWVTSVGIPVYLIRLTVPSKMQFWDYEQPDLLIRHGREITRNKLDSEPLKLQSAWRLWLKRVATRLKSRRVAPQEFADETYPEVKER